MTALLIIFGIILLISLLYAVLVAHRENEPRATRMFCGSILLIPLLYFITAAFSFPGKLAIALILLSFPVLGFLLLLLPISFTKKIQDSRPTLRIDERDTMFSRQELHPGSPRYKTYYRTHPKEKAADDIFRSHPGLLSAGTRCYHSRAFAAAEASFDTIKYLRTKVDGEFAGHPVDLDPQEITLFLKHWTLQLGAEDIGITRLHPYHLYSRGGRDQRYGQPIEPQHSFAIALSVPMDMEMIHHAPQAPVVMESARQYLKAGVIAIQLAACIRRLGYTARAHIDGNYEVVCPLVARDAGLGEIGRMGLLMTPRQGPRIRLAVVTTNLALVTDSRTFDPTVIDFCEHCQKCAHNCPAQAIPTHTRQQIDGVLRWQINSEACFTYWAKTGTDCARCIRVCPYAHPDNLFHNLIRRLIRHSGLVRRWAVVLDDFIYGKRPTPRPLPAWMQREKTLSPDDKNINAESYH